MLEVALGYLAVVAPSYLALGIGIVLGSAMTGAGATRTTMLIDLGVVFGISTPAGDHRGHVDRTRPRAPLEGRRGDQRRERAGYVLNYRRRTFLEGGALPFRLG